MSNVFLVTGTHPYVPGRALSIHATAEGARNKAAALINIIRADMKHELTVEEANRVNFDEVLQKLKERYADLYETDEERFDVWIEFMEIEQ